MSFIHKLFSYFSGSKSQENRVRLSPSTLQHERDRFLRQIASPRPLQNLRNDLRLTALEKAGRDRLTLKQSSALIKKANYLWKNMSEDGKFKYYELARNSEATHIPALTLQKLARQNLPAAQPRRSRRVQTMAEKRLTTVAPRMTSNNYDQAAEIIPNDQQSPATISSIVGDQVIRQQADKRKHGDGLDSESETLTTRTSLNGALIKTIESLAPDQKRSRRD
ncbi:uncharacterized protein LOC117584260 [Drosophila guanche]|uniref:Uncharacterized protein n=1 Tax=Drosophila guanche TaxID=7266 RepID=A0A3B0K8Y1_DROGU|nr:uncharacterized protein LOC117584260 [Drosophila guanche]SPP82086.1 Hypothetical predicted protein [Drosophila guanche]